MCDQVVKTVMEQSYSEEDRSCDRDNEQSRTATAVYEPEIHCDPAMRNWFAIWLSEHNRR